MRTLNQYTERSESARRLEVGECPEITETFFQGEVVEVRRSERRKVRDRRSGR